MAATAAIGKRWDLLHGGIAGCYRWIYRLFTLVNTMYWMDMPALYWFSLSIMYKYAEFRRVTLTPTQTKSDARIHKHYLHFVSELSLRTPQQVTRILTL